MPDPGVYSDIPPDIYHSGPEISISGLKTFAQAPAKYRYGVRRPTKAMALGSLVHTAILEPDQVEARYFVSKLDRLDPRTKAYQAEEERAQGREIIKVGDYETALRMRDAVHANSAAAALLAPTIVLEQAIYWTDPETGIACRGRADIMRPDDCAIVDIKKTEDGGLKAFAKAIATYRYHWQDVFYTDGMEQLTGQAWRFAFIAVEPELPHLVATYEVDEAGRRKAREDVAYYLMRYRQCLRDDDWPGYPPGLQSVSLPGWAMAE